MLIYRHQIRTITRVDLPDLLARWQRDHLSGFALLNRNWTFYWFEEKDWILDEIFACDDSISWNDLAPIVECSGLRRLALPDVGLGGVGARVIAEQLTNLQSLYLVNNNVGDAGARAIAENLTNLQSLHIGSNHVGEAGVMAIAENLTNLH